MQQDIFRNEPNYSPEASRLSVSLANRLHFVAHVRDAATLATIQKINCFSRSELPTKAVQQ